MLYCTVLRENEGGHDALRLVHREPRRERVIHTRKAKGDPEGVNRGQGLVVR